MISGDAPSGTPGDPTSAVVFLFLGGVFSGDGFLPGTGSRAETRFLARVPLRVEGSSPRGRSDAFVLCERRVGIEDIAMERVRLMIYPKAAVSICNR